MANKLCFLVIILSLFFLSIFLFKKSEKFAIVVLIGIFFFLGIFCYQQENYFASHNATVSLAKQEKRQDFFGLVIDEPQIKDENISFHFEPYGLKGSILIQKKTKEVLAYGDEIKVSGILSLPPIFEDFDYRRYLAKDRTYGQMFDPDIKIVDQGQGNKLYGAIIAFRQKARVAIENNWPGEDGAIIRAFLLGDKAMGDKFKEALNFCGLSHIIAISGAHIAMFIAIFLPILLALGLWRQQAMGLMLGFIVFFLALSAFQVSAIRSVIMGGLVIVAELFGRRSDPLRLLLFAATFMLAFNPLLLGSDVGFQLSFSAVAGLAILSSWWKEKLKFVPELGFLELRSILAMTFSALVFSWPIISYNFGTLSTISLITNILANPVMPFLMFFSIASVVLAIVWPFLGVLAGLPCRALLAYLKVVVYGFGALPFVQITYRVPVLLYFDYYLLLAWAIFLGRKRLEFL